MASLNMIYTPPPCLTVMIRQRYILMTLHSSYFSIIKDVIVSSILFIQTIEGQGK